MVVFRNDFADSLANTGGLGNRKKYITVHETDNFSKGANARAHANLQKRGFSASWHWTVDDKEAVMSFPHGVICWHAGDGARGIGNTESIAIEICVNSDSDRSKTLRNAIELVADIAKKEEIPLKNIVQHNRWSGKNCPSQIRKNGQWDWFISEVRKITGDHPSIQKPQKTINELAKEVIAGKYGNGDKRKRLLGDKYEAVQKEVKRILEKNKKPVFSLAVDGSFGVASVSRLQSVLGTVVDGVVSGQARYSKNFFPALVSVTYGSTGSTAIRALQRKLGVTADGLFGPNTIRAWQRKLKVTVDGYFGPASARAAQVVLNNGRLF